MEFNRTRGSSAGPLDPCGSVCAKILGEKISRGGNVLSRVLLWSPFSIKTEFVAALRTFLLIYYSPNTVLRSLKRKETKLNRRSNNISFSLVNMPMSPAYCQYPFGSWYGFVLSCMRSVQSLAVEKVPFLLVATVMRRQVCRWTGWPRMDKSSKTVPFLSLVQPFEWLGTGMDGIKAWTLVMRHPLDALWKASGLPQMPSDSAGDSSRLCGNLTPQGVVVILNLLLIKWTSRVPCWSMKDFTT